MPWIVEEVTLVPASAGYGDAPARTVLFRCPSQEDLADSGIPIDQIRAALPPGTVIDATAIEGVGTGIRTVLEAAGVPLLNDPDDAYIYVPQDNGYHAVIRWPSIGGEPYVYRDHDRRALMFVAVAVRGRLAAEDK